jgi:hypothetical protein
MENQSSPTNTASNLGNEFLASFNAERFVARLKEVLSDPLSAWQKIRDEQYTIKQLYLQYLLVLVIVPAICEFIGMSLLGPIPLSSGIKMLIWKIVFGLAGAYGAALLVKVLAPKFGGSAGEVDGLKLFTFSMMPAAAASALFIIPILRFILALIALAGAIYGLYIMWLGIPILLSVPTEKRVPFFISLVGSILVAALVISWIGANLGLVA